MPLEAPVLDDLTWDDLVQVARSRIPAASAGEWTLHSPTDAGITLLELFAAELEERLYWLDQPCDARQRAILKFLGVQPRPAMPAATVLAFCKDPAENETPPSYSEVPRGLVLQPQPPPTSYAPVASGDRNGKTLPEFTTLFPILFFPLAAPESNRPTPCLSTTCVNIRIGGKDYTRDLQMGRGVRLWIDPAEQDVDVDIELLVNDALPAKTAGTLGMFLDIETAPGVVPQWLRGGIVPEAPATLTWSYQAGAGTFKAFGPGDVQDGTKGLRRPGVIRFQLRDTTVWQPNAGVAPFAYPLRLSIRNASYPTPPRLRQIVPNAVLARHFRRVESAPDNLAALAKQLFDWNLVQTPSPNLPLSDLGQAVVPNLVRLYLQQSADAQAYCWRPVANTASSGPDDRVFAVDRALGQLTFGDGYNGRLPVNATVTKLSYWIGGGRAGNLSAGRVWRNTDHADHWVAVNVVQARGGDDPEPLADAARRTAVEWHRPTRCVTAADCEALAMQTPGVPVARAHAVVGRDPQYPCTPIEGAVTVYVVPDVPQPSRDDWSAHPETWAAPLPDQPILRRVQCNLERARLLTQQVFVRAPLYRDIAIAITIAGIPADSDRVRSDATLELYRAFNPLWGGAYGGGWPFGGPVYPSEIMERVQKILPTGLIVDRVEASRADDPASATDCEPLAVGAHNLPALTRVQVRFHPQPQLEGGLG